MRPAQEDNVIRYLASIADSLKRIAEAQEKRNKPAEAGSDQWPFLRDRLQIGDSRRCAKCDHVYNIGQLGAVCPECKYGGSYAANISVDIPDDR